MLSRPGERGDAPVPAGLFCGEPGPGEDRLPSIDDSGIMRKLDAFL
jgi:hypothetical protein